MLGIALRHDGEVGLSQQIYRSLKAQIITGQLTQGEELPSTRELAGALDVSRNTVSVAYDMLWTEGYINRKQGAPSRVANGLQLKHLQAANESPKAQAVRKPDILWNFQSGKPDLSVFPWTSWNQMIKQAADTLSPRQLAYTGPKGYEPLCEEIAGWLFRTRGMEVKAGDVFITSGATQALFLLVEMFGRTRLPFALEDPSHPGVRTLLKDRGIPVHWMRVDAQGADVASLNGRDIAAAYVTPSHQFPLGGILPAARRAALIRYAAEKDFYIMEDDYDSEFRYEGSPVSPIYTMDSTRVAYIGTFSKTMFPALRIGFAVLPKALQGRWRHAKTYLDVQNPVLEQAALQAFLQARKMDKHIRHMRRLYGEKRGVLLESLRQSFGTAVVPWGDASGLHIALQFPQHRFDETFAAMCRKRGMRIAPLMRYCAGEQTHEDKLLLGYGHLNPEQIRDGVRMLRQWIG